ncbi:hypothetical protein Goari_011436, partial [Gossypium aridum]|nr:hypothetical protein [Gossypium aridum]
IENTDDLQERSLEAEDETKLEEVITPIVEPEKEKKLKILPLQIYHSLQD